MSDWKNRATKIDSTNNWKSRASAAPAENDDANLANTILNKGLEGASMSFNDEFAGAVNAAGKMVGLDNAGSNKLSDIKISDDGPTLSYEKLKQAYEFERNHRRALSKLMEEAHPVASTVASMAGSLAVPMGAAKSLAAKAAIGAGQGAISGYGQSNEDSFGGNMKDAMLGAGIGAAVPVALTGIGKGISKVAQKLPEDMGKKIAAKIGSFTSGVDEDALLRQAQRPNQVVAAKADDFVYNLANTAQDEIEVVGKNLGTNSGTAKKQFLSNFANEPMTGAGSKLAESTDELLGANTASAKGFSGLNQNQIETLSDISSNLKNGEMNGADLVKIRDYIDHVEKMNGKYDKDGTGMYANFLKQLRGQANEYLQAASPEIAQANGNYSKFLGDKKVLGMNNESTAEGVIGSLFGANKGAKQTAAQSVLSLETFEAAKDIASNKAVNAANVPGGQNYFRHGALPAMTFGASELVTRPNLVAAGMRGIGKVDKKVGEISQRIMNSKFGKTLAEAKARGNSSYAVTHFLLQQSNPEYQQLYKEGQKDDQ